MCEGRLQGVRETFSPGELWYFKHTQGLHAYGLQGGWLWSCHLGDISDTVKWPDIVPVQATTKSRCLKLSSGWCVASKWWLHYRSWGGISNTFGCYLCFGLDVSS